MALNHCALRLAQEFERVRRDKVTLRTFLEGQPHTFNFITEGEMRRFVSDSIAPKIVKKEFALDLIRRGNENFQIFDGYVTPPGEDCILSTWEYGLMPRILINDEYEYEGSRISIPLELPPHSYALATEVLARHNNPGGTNKILCLQPRRTFKTLTVSIAAFIHTVLNIPDSQVLAISFSKTEAMEILEYLLKFYDVCPEPRFRNLIDELLKPHWDKRENSIWFKGKSGMQKVKLRNTWNEQIEKTLKGSHVPFIIIDECAQIKEETVLKTEGNAKPGAVIVMMTTPTAKDDWTQNAYMADVLYKNQHLAIEDEYTAGILREHTLEIRDPSEYDKVDLSRQLAYSDWTVMRVRLDQVIDNIGRHPRPPYSWDAISKMRENARRDPIQYQQFLAEYMVQWATIHGGPAFPHGVSPGFLNYIPPHPTIDLTGLDGYLPLTHFRDVRFGMDIGLTHNRSSLIIIGKYIGPDNWNLDEDERALDKWFVLYHSQKVGAKPFEQLDWMVNTCMAYHCFIGVMDEHGSGGPIYSLWEDYTRQDRPMTRTLKVLKGHWGDGTGAKKLADFSNIQSMLSMGTLKVPRPEYVSRAVPESGPAGDFYRSLAMNLSDLNTQLGSFYFDSSNRSSVTRTTIKKGDSVQYDDAACSLAFALSGVTMSTGMRRILSTLFTDTPRDVPSNMTPQTTERNRMHVEFANSRERYQRKKEPRGRLNLPQRGMSRTNRGR